MCGVLSLLLAIVSIMDSGKRFWRDQNRPISHARCDLADRVVLLVAMRVSNPPPQRQRCSEKIDGDYGVHKIYKVNTF